MWSKAGFRSAAAAVRVEIGQMCVCVSVCVCVCVHTTWLVQTMSWGLVTAMIRNSIHQVAEMFELALVEHAAIVRIRTNQRETSIQQASNTHTGGTDSLFRFHQRFLVCT